MQSNDFEIGQHFDKSEPECPGIFLTRTVFLWPISYSMIKYLLRCLVKTAFCQNGHHSSSENALMHCKFKCWLSLQDLTYYFVHLHNNHMDFIRPEKTEWWGTDVVICLGRGADFQVAQLMLLPLTVSCIGKIQIGFNFLVPAHLDSPRWNPECCKMVVHTHTTILLLFLKMVVVVVVVVLYELPSVLWHCWLGGMKGIRPVKKWVVGCWRGCLGWGADLHIAQQMPLPLTISCSSKSRLVLTFLVLPFWYLLTRVVLDMFQKSSKMVVCV